MPNLPSGSGEEVKNVKVDTQTEKGWTKGDQKRSITESSIQLKRKYFKAMIFPQERSIYVSKLTL